MGEDLGVHVVGAADQRGVPDLARITGGHDPALAHGDEHVGVPGGRGHVVHDHEHGTEAHWATLLGVVETYCHPEIATDDGYERLQRLASRTDDEEMRVFKKELREAIIDPSQIPGGSLFWAAEYDDGSDEAFLARLWRDLYPGEPMPTA